MAMFGPSLQKGKNIEIAMRGGSRIALGPARDQMDKKNTRIYQANNVILQLLVH
jgi:hypothetical protein